MRPLLILPFMVAGTVRNEVQRGTIMAIQLERQHRQGVIFSTMMLGIFEELLMIHSRGNLRMSVHDFWVAMAVYRCADTNALTAAEISACTRIKLSTVYTICKRLVKIGILISDGAARDTKYLSNPIYANNPAWSEQTERVRDLIIEAAIELCRLWKITNPVI